MAKFKVGDRVQVRAEARGIKEELLGAKGTVKAQRVAVGQGVQRLGEPFKPLEYEPAYDIEFDGIDELERLIGEALLVPA